MRSKINTERGQALVVIALSIVVLFGFAALALDGSAKFSDRRHAQNAADTSALAAAYSKVDNLTKNVSDNSPTTGAPATCPPPTGVLPSPVCAALITAGKDRASSNGYDNNLTTNTVDVYSPPISGYYAGNTSYVQVIIKSDVRTYLARVIGIDKTTNTVQAVAFTKKGGPLFDGASFVSVNPNPNCGVGGGGGSFDVGGAGNITLNGGGIFVNSDASCGYSQTSCMVSLTINGGGIISAGSDINQSCGVPASEDQTHEQILVPEEIYMPDAPPECGVLATAYEDPPSSDIWHITPGYYSDFPQSNLNGDIIGTKKDIVMDPGVYCVGKDIKWSAVTFDSLDGSSGVTIYMKPGFKFSLSIDSPINLDASNSGDYAGYLIIVDGDMNNLQSCTINGGSQMDLNGTVYAPYCNVTINGDNNSNSVYNVQVIGWDVKINGSSMIDFTYNPGNNAKNQRRVGLMK